jgi:ketosteroid isomerase-like protein
MSEANVDLVRRLFTFRDGKIVRFEEFTNRDQALAAAAPSA